MQDLEGETSVQAPAGWYPVGDGERYWDGRQWADLVVVPTEPAIPPRPPGWYQDPERRGVRWWDGTAWAPRDPGDIRNQPVAARPTRQSVPLVIPVAFAAIAGSLVGLVWWLIGEHEILGDYSSYAITGLICFAVLPILAGTAAIALAERADVAVSMLFAIVGALVTVGVLAGLAVTVLPADPDGFDEIAGSIVLMLGPSTSFLLEQLRDEWMWCGLAGWTLTGGVIAVSAYSDELRLPAVIGGATGGLIAGAIVVVGDFWDASDGNAGYAAPAIALAIIALGASVGQRIRRD